LLRGIAGYRKKDPSDSEESEYVQNMFDCLCALMLLPEHQAVFGKVQGLELMIRMIGQHNFCSNLAVRLTDHSLRHCPANCQMFVDKLGLKVLFPIFMKKGVKMKSKGEAKELEEHVTSIIQSLCRYCTGTPMARVLNKFMENNFEKLERLLEMHDEYVRAVRVADAARNSGEVKSIDRDLEVDDEEQLFLDRCDAGLFTLQQVDIIVVRLANMGNRQATEEIGKLLDTKGVPLEETVSVIEEYCSHLDDSARKEREELRACARGLIRRCAPDEAAAEALERRLGGGEADAVTGKTGKKAPEEEERQSSPPAERQPEERRKDKKDERKDKKERKSSAADKKEKKSHKD